MKIRTGFVSNSSSSSFVVPKDALTDLQKFLIQNYDEVVMRFQEFPPFQKMKNDLSEPWIIEENEKNLRGQTFMDNFDMLWFMEQIGIDDAVVF